MTDGDVISELYAGSFRRLVVQLYAVTGDLNEAQEAVQESFTRALAALRQLPQGQRHALALHYLVDLPVDEVAATLGVSVGTVKSRMSRGRRALAELLDDSGVNDDTSTGRINAHS